MPVSLRCLRCGGPATRIMQTGEIACARSCREPAATTGKRIALEASLRPAVEAARATLPKGVGLILVLADYGENGTSAYASTMEREGAVSLLRELVDRMAAET